MRIAANSKSSKLSVYQETEHVETGDVNMPKSRSSGRTVGGTGDGEGWASHSIGSVITSRV